MQDHAGEGFLVPKLRLGNIARKIVVKGSMEGHPAFPVL